MHSASRPCHLHACRSPSLLQAKQRFQRLRSLQEHSRSFTPEELAVVRGQFFRGVVSTCAALSSSLPFVSEVIQSVSSILDQRPDFLPEEFLSDFVNERPESVMALPAREFLRRWAAWMARKAGWKGDALNLRVPHDLKHGDFYSFLFSAIKVLSCNDVFTPYLPKGESLKLGSSLIFVGEKITKDWAKKKAVILSARIAAGDLEDAQSKQFNDSGSVTNSSAEWSSSGSGSEGSDGETEVASDDDDLDEDEDTCSQLSYGSQRNVQSRSTAPSVVNSDKMFSDSGSEEDSAGDSSSGSAADSSDEDSYSKAGSTRSGGSSRSNGSGIKFSIGTRIKQQNQVRRVLGNESALEAELAEMEEESRRNMIQERKEAAKQHRAQKNADRKGGKKKKSSKKDKNSKVSFKDGADGAKPNKPKKKMKRRRKRRSRLKVNLAETDEQRELRRLLMVRDAIIKSNRPLREGSERIYRTFKLAAKAIITGVRSYRAAMGFFFKYKPPPELNSEGQTPKERMAVVVDLFRQFLPAGFLVDFGEFPGVV